MCSQKSICFLCFLAFPKTTLQCWTPCTMEISTKLEAYQFDQIGNKLICTLRGHSKTTWTGFWDFWPGPIKSSLDKGGVRAGPGILVKMVDFSDIRHQIGSQIGHFGVQNGPFWGSQQLQGASEHPIWWPFTLRICPFGPFGPFWAYGSEMGYFTPF